MSNSRCPSSSLPLARRRICIAKTRRRRRQHAVNAQGEFISLMSPRLTSSQLTSLRLNRVRCGFADIRQDSARPMLRFDRPVAAAANRVARFTAHLPAVVPGSYEMRSDEMSDYVNAPWKTAAYTAVIIRDCTHCSVTAADEWSPPATPRINPAICTPDESASTVLADHRRFCAVESRNLSSQIDLQTHAGSAFDNRATLTLILTFLP